MHRNESRYGSNKDNLDAKPANESAKHDNLKNAICEAICAQDVSDIARCKAKTTDIYRHGKEKWLDGVRCRLQGGEIDITSNWYEYLEV